MTMKKAIPLLATALIVGPCVAGPLVTIRCDPPKGRSQFFGVTAAEKVQAAGGKSQPANHLSSVMDGMNASPTFIVDEDSKRLTLIWATTAGEAALTKLAQEYGQTWHPDPAREIQVLNASPLVITALDSHPGLNGAVFLYSFYPKLGALFVSQHYLDINGGSALQAAFFAKCDFAWTRKP
jgi:hypothetical protein